MKTKTIPMNGYDAILYKTDKYTSMHMSFTFQIKYTKRNSYACDVLAGYADNTNMIYKTKKELRRENRKNYGVNIGFSSFNIGTKLFVTFNLSFTDPKLVKDNYSKKVIKFASDYLYKPNFENDKLDQDVLTEVKNKLISSFRDRMSSPGGDYNILFTKFIAKDTFLDKDMVESIEEYENLIESIKDEEIINLYNEIINNSFIGCILSGNYDDEILEEIKNNFVFNKIKELETDYTEIIPFNLDSKYMEVSSNDLHESNISVAYSIKNYKPQDECIYTVITMALGSVGSTMQKILREERQLVYTSWPSFVKMGGYIVLNASISKENKDKILEGFNEVIDKLKDEDYVSKVLERVKKAIDLQNYIEDEEHYRIWNRLESETYKWQEPLEKRMAIVTKLTEKDIIEAVNRLKQEAVFFYRGDK